MNLEFSTMMTFPEIDERSEQDILNGFNPPADSIASSKLANYAKTALDSYKRTG